MRRAALSLTLLTLVLAAPAQAFVLQTVELQGKLLHPRWDTADLPLRFSVNDRPLDLLPNVSRTSNPLAAILAAMQSWAIGPVSLEVADHVATTDPAKDGVNLITLANTARTRDLIGNAWGVTLGWNLRQGNLVRLAETDIILSPTQRLATDGNAAAGDIQSILTHELGHALGLEHSAIVAATMFPAGSAGQTTLRSLEADDVAAIQQLYAGDTSGDTGAISGRVLTTGGAPVFGAHLTATDADGIVRVGGLTDRDGNFTLPSLPAGAYQLYAEPLDGPMLPEDLSDAYFNDRSHPLRHDFLTTFVGGNASPTTVRVTAGKTTGIDPIRVDPQKPGLNPEAFFWTRDFKAFFAWPAPIRSGQPLFFIVIGMGSERVPTAGFRVSSPNIAIDYANVGRGAFKDGTPYVILPLSAGAGARPGARNLYLVTDTERVALTGVLEVPSP